MKTYNTKLLFKLRLWAMSLIVLSIGLVPDTLSQGNKDTHISFSGRSSSRHVHIEKGRLNSYELKYRGTIELTDDDTDIKSISPGGYFKVSKTTFGNKRSIYIENKGGQLVKEYYVGRRQEPFIPDGKAWLADILPEVIRNTGIGAEKRVLRIYRKSGVNGVLNEISKIDGDYVKGIYFDALLDQASLNDGDKVRILEGISEEMNSSYEQSKLLTNHSGEFIKSQKSAEAFFRSASEISSDYEKGKVLKAAFNEADVEGAAFGEALEAISTISSDYEASKLLMHVLASKDLDDERFQEVIEIVGDISSDYEKGKILNELSDDKDLSDKRFKLLLDSYSEISSNYEKAKVLKRLIDEQDLNDFKVEEILEAAEHLSSGYESRNVLKKLIQEAEFNDENFETLLESVDDISSSYDKTNVYKQILSDLDLEDDELMSIIDYVSKVSSNYEKSGLLIIIAKKIPKGNTKLREAFIDAAKSISSDYEYGKVMRSLNG
ncbi:hypothetical protein QQ008_23715 [Fulvivirgaceae bacterium BMA10]|uniref:Uncharacterized protein n=1 Tax=Splendidivirga corallicola TaxID=3051826 RepID=A0ABT8KUG4_9BACT|nr:hypothetical protein [Fulvivirgaceae bacterium BMA10]